MGTLCKEVKKKANIILPFLLTKKIFYANNKNILKFESEVRKNGFKNYNGITELFKHIMASFDTSFV